MPRQLFYHICDGKSVYTPNLVCYSCGEPGERTWYLETHELQARYQYVYELKPAGPHRSLADWLLGELREPCPRCVWVGLLTLDAQAPCHICPVCEGTGGFWKAPPEDVEAVRQAILRLFPNAAAAPIPGFLSGVVTA